MPLTEIKDMMSKIAVGVTTAALLASFGLIAKMYHDIENINRTHVRYEEIIDVRATRFESAERRIDGLEADVRNILINNQPQSGTYTGPGSSGSLTEEQAAWLMDAVKRQNCMLSGGPSRRPLPPACRGIRQ